MSLPQLRYFVAVAEANAVAHHGDPGVATAPRHVDHVTRLA